MVRTLLSRLVVIAAAASMCLLAPIASMAQEAGSSQTIKVVVPFPPGGGSDGIARALAEALHGTLKTTVIVDNRPGAAGNIGAAFVLREPADGLTLLMAANNLTTNPHLYKLQFDPLKDFTPIGLIASSPLVLIVGNSVPASNIAELVSLSKGPRGSVFYGSPGAATPMHLAGVLVARSTGAQFAHVPYRGTGQAIADVLGGQVQAAVVGLSSAAPLMKSGRVKALALFSKARAPEFPELPTALEQGIPGSDVVVWYSLVLKAGTPEPVVSKIKTAFAALRSDKKLLSQLESAGFNADLTSAEEFARVLKSDYDKWGKLIKDAGITLE